jgi:CheY-like chemotaxis protein
VYLPVHDGVVAEEAPGPADVPHGHGERILLVDDEAMLADAGRRMLELLDYRVTALTNPVEALAVFRTRPGAFDLAVLDLSMPALGGVELARELFGIRPGLPALLNTGFGGRMTPETARRLGFRGLLVKPLTLGVLGRAVHEALAAD